MVSTSCCLLSSHWSVLQDLILTCTIISESTMHAPGAHVWPLHCHNTLHGTNCHGKCIALALKLPAAFEHMCKTRGCISLTGMTLLQVPQQTAIIDVFGAEKTFLAPARPAVRHTARYRQGQLDKMRSQVYQSACFGRGYVATAKPAVLCTGSQGQADGCQGC